MGRTLALVLLAALAAPCSAALMNTPQPAPAWLKVRLTPLSSWRANTQHLFAPGEIDYTGFPLPNGGLSYLGFNSLHYAMLEDPLVESFWILKATDSIVGIVAQNQTLGYFTEHDFAPEIAAGIDVVTATMGELAAGQRTFTYTGANGYSRQVSLPATPAPEPSGAMLAMAASLCLGWRRTRPARR